MMAGPLEVDGGGDVEWLLVGDAAHGAAQDLAGAGLGQPVDDHHLLERVVPAPTVLAIADRLGGPVEVLRFPVSHSDAPEEGPWRRFERRWLELAVNGVGDGFGR
jgi:hypothetical protein